MKAIEEIKSGKIHEYPVEHEYGPYRHAYMPHGEWTYASRLVRVCSPDVLTRYIAQSVNGLEEDDYASFVQLPRVHDAHVRGGASALARPDYWEKRYVIAESVVL